MSKRNFTSWENVHEWYDREVGKDGHYYHEHVIFPHLLRLLNTPRKILDVGCGQGVLSRKLPKSSQYLGLDLSESLIGKAKTLQPWRKERFIVQDACAPFILKEKDFSHAVCLLSLQNLADPKAALYNIAQHLELDGRLLLVLNHPCFRIPRQSGWHVDAGKKLQSRRVDRYMSPLEIPIQTNPSQGENSTQSMSFHHPLSFYSQLLFETGFSIERIEEWCSDKASTGASARMENRARQEFPLFLAILAKKRTFV